jgi:hypothetical protein
MAVRLTGFLHGCLQGYHDQQYKQRRIMIANIARQHEV